MIISAFLVGKSEGFSRRKLPAGAEAQSKVPIVRHA